VTLRLTDPVLKSALVWGQYTRTGKNTHFGFGAYRIQELGPEPFACRRALTLLEQALCPPAVDRAAAAAELPAGELFFARPKMRSFLDSCTAFCFNVPFS
jgi:hypothetical protein